MRRRKRALAAGTRAAASCGECAISAVATSTCRTSGQSRVRASGASRCSSTRRGAIIDRYASIVFLAGKKIDHMTQVALPPAPEPTVHPDQLSFGA